MGGGENIGHTDIGSCNVHSISDYRIWFLESGKKNGKAAESSRKERACKAEE